MASLQPTEENRGKSDCSTVEDNLFKKHLYNEKDNKIDKNEIKSKNKTKNVYMDYNATTPLAPSVVKEISNALTSAWGNPSSSYDAGIHAKHLIQKSRCNVLKMINGKELSQIIFMSGGTEANNHVIQSCLTYYRHHINNERCMLDQLDLPKPHFITSLIEHDSILNTVKYLEKENLIDASYVNVSKRLGRIDADDVLREILDETVLISIMLANNETGVIQPIKYICEGVSTIERNREGEHPMILVHTDAAQAFGKIKVDVQELGVDYLTIVGHKFYGPRIGALWVRSSYNLYPLFHGGGQEMGKRPGTENTCMIAGLGEAARLVVDNLTEYENHFKEIRYYLKEKLLERFHERVAFHACSCQTLPNTLNISVIGTNLTGRKVLDACKVVQASIGAACHTHLGDTPSNILLEHGVTEALAKNAIRLSLGRETTKADIDYVVNDLEEAVISLS